MHFPWPSDDEGLSLHRRLCDGDAAAPSDFAADYTDPLVSWLRVNNRGVDADSCMDAAHRAILDLIRRPAAYDPARGELAAYLRMSAKRDLLNLLRTENRHHRGRTPWETVEDGPCAGKYLEKDDDPAAVAVHDEEARRGAAILDAVREGLNERDRRVFDLMREGEYSTRAIAAALNLSDRPPAEQEREAKRAKDRINKRIERAGGAS